MRLAAFLVISTAISLSAVSENGLNIQATLPSAQDAPASQRKAPVQDLIFERISKADGLPTEGPYRSIVQDKEGFLWLGTDTGGLIRYDGYQFETFRRDPADSTSISSNAVHSIFVDMDGFIWIGTLRGGGLNRLDTATGIFSRFLERNSVRNIVQTPDKFIWVSESDGLSKLDPVSGEIIAQYRHEEGVGSSLLDDNISSLYVDRDGLLWIASAGGLNRFDPMLGVFDEIRIREYGANQRGVRRVNGDSDGNIYLSTCDPIPLKVPKGSDEAVSFLPQAVSDRILAATRGYDPDICKGAQFLEWDDDGQLWFDGWGMGVIRYNPGSETMAVFSYSPEDPNSLSSVGATAFYQDRQGIYWIGTFLQGINKGIPDRFQLIGEDEISQNRGVFSLYEDAVGNIWIGTYGGQLFQLDPSSKILKRYSNATPLPDGRWRNGIESILVDSRNKLWVGQQRGLFRFDLNDNTHTEFLETRNDGRLERRNWNTFLMEDRHGIIWIGNYFRGLFRYHPEEGTTIRRSYNQTDEEPLPLQQLQTMYEDREGNLWVGTEAGQLNRLHQQPHSTGSGVGLTFETYLDGFSIQNMREDSKGRFWVGTLTRGLILLDRQTRETVQYTMRDGLPNYGVQSITEDTSGMLWLSTLSGLVRFDPETEHFSVYGPEDGFSNQTSHPGLLLINRDGVLYAGGNNGLTAIDLNSFSPNRHPPTTVVTRVKVFNEERDFRGQNNNARELSHEENEVSFEYVGLHFANPKQNKYMYRLEGYDDVWRSVGTVRSATYTNLSPGNYAFHVKSASSEGVWDESGTSFSFTILPPWYQTTWSYILYALLFGGVLFTADRIQRRRLVRKERERTRDRELEQAREIRAAYEKLESTQAQLVQSEKMASLGQLTAGIAHEIKNPLNFINNFAEVNEELIREAKEAFESGDPEEGKALLDDLMSNSGIISQHGKRADSIVHSMMLHASGNSGERQVTDINRLVAEYVDLAFHGKRASDKSFSAEVNRIFGSNVESAVVNPGDIGRVILNILGNAFDAVSEKSGTAGDGYKPSVSIETRKSGNEIEIVISDNGPGVSADLRDRIFEPFFTTKASGKGTGLGLSLSYDIVTQGHGGKLTLETNKDSGSTFVIQIPADSPV